MRIPKRVANRLGLSEGDVVKVDIVEKVRREGEVNLSSLPTFRDEDRRASLHHDRYLYGQSGEGR